MSAVSRRQVWTADAALLAVTAIWGITFSIVKAGLGDASPLLFNAARMSLAALVLLAVYRPHRRRLPPALWRASAVLGALLAAGYALQTVGLERTTASQSAFITSLSVVMVPLLVALGWRRRLPLGVWLGVMLALLGLVLLVLSPGLEPKPGAAAGNWLTLACALAFALQIVCLGEIAPRWDFRDLATLQIGFAAVFTWASIPALEAPRWHFGPTLALALGLTAVLATAVAFSVQSWAQQFTPATHTAVVFAFEPGFAWLAALWGWHERLRLIQLAGAALIVAAMVVVGRGDTARLSPDPFSSPPPPA